MRNNINKILLSVFLTGFMHFVVPQAFAAGMVSNKMEVAVPAGRGVVDEIMGHIGLKPNFELREADVENAAAVVYNGRRYILYNSRFMHAVNTASKTDWAAVSILAHEIGHHLNGHTLSSHGSNHADELEADEFSGFVLRKMGASLAEAQAAMRTISSERDSYTHPGKSRRLNAIAMGWNNANEQLLAMTNPNHRGQVVREKQVSQPAPEKPVQTRVATQPVLASQHILKEVHLKNAPYDKFYLTTKYNLVRVNQEGIQVIGKVKRTDDEAFPYIIVDEYNNAQLFISYKGIMVNSSGKTVGYLKEHSQV